MHRLHLYGDVSISLWWWVPQPSSKGRQDNGDTVHVLARTLPAQVVCVYGGVECIHGVQVPPLMCVCKDQRKTLGILFYHSLSYSLTTGFPLSLELGLWQARSNNPAVQTTLGLLVLVGICQAFYMGARDLNLGYTVSALIFQNISLASCPDNSWCQTRNWIFPFLCVPGLSHRSPHR